MPKKKSVSTAKKSPKSPPAVIALGPSPPYPGDQNLIVSPPYPSPPQPGEIGYKFNASVEAPWELLSGLNLDDTKQIRRVMAMIHDPLSEETTALNSKYSAKRLHRWERAIVHRIIRESKGNYLLYKMLTWLGTYWDKSDREAETALDLIIQKATIYVRRRELYEEDYIAAKEDWKQFVGASWEDPNGLMDPEPGTEEVNFADHRDFDYEELRQKHLSTFEYEYFLEDLYKDDPDYLTEGDAPEDFPTETKTLKVGPLKLNIFNEEPKSTGRLRSGKFRGEELKYIIDFPGTRKQREKEQTEDEDLDSEEEESTKKQSTTRKGRSTCKSKAVPIKPPSKQRKKLTKKEDQDKDYVEEPRKTSVNKRKKSDEEPNDPQMKILIEIKALPVPKRARKQVETAREKFKEQKSQTVEEEVEDDFNRQKLDKRIWKVDGYNGSCDSSSRGGMITTFRGSKLSKKKDEPLITVPNLMEPPVSLTNNVPEFSSTPSSPKYPFVSVAQSLGIAPPVKPQVYSPTSPRHADLEQEDNGFAENFPILAKDKEPTTSSCLQPDSACYPNTNSSGDAAMFNTNPVQKVSARLNTFEGVAPIPRCTPQISIRRSVTPSVSRLNSPSIEHLNMLNEGYEIDDGGVRRRQGSALSSQSGGSPRRRIIQISSLPNMQFPTTRDEQG